MSPRSKSTLKMYMESDPEGSLLAEEGGKIVGYGFARRFGTLGCIGPIAVQPNAQGRGFGKRITEA
ncbi:MAG: GNAT family N-acetyltransferase [Candidatus Bathyarchaeota archaeon]|nr:GNAT family N-acetyltransferase [Candidatus Bathyarchaeota archaeon]MDH5788476.1 GNAT family N-acetyltransferase [Candidatus Bathyarchaeota archaeon]